MMRASVRTGTVLAVCAAVSLSWMTIGPAQADDPDPLGAVLGAVDPADPVGTVTDVSHQAVDQVRSVVSPAPQPAAPDPAPAQPAAPKPAPPKPAAPHVASPQATAPHAASPQPAPHTSSTEAAAAPPASHTHHARPERTRTSPARASVRAAVRRAAPRSAVAPAVAQVVAPAAAPVALRQVAGERNPATACSSASLDPRDLKRCANVDALIPNLGGPELPLLPIGLVTLGTGVVMVVSGRRRPSVSRAA